MQIDTYTYYYASFIHLFLFCLTFIYYIENHPNT